MKKIIYSFIAVLFAALGWYFFSLVVSSNSTLQANIVNIVGFLLMLGLSYGFMFIVALGRNKLDFFLTSLISSLWILVFLGSSLQTGISALALFIASQALMEFPSSLEKSIDLRYFSTAYTKIALVALVLIGISSGYIQQNLNKTIAQQGFTQKTSNYIWPYIKGYISQFNSEQSVDEFLEQQFAEQGVKNPQAYMLTQEKQRLSEQFGFKISGKEKMSDLGKSFLSTQISDFLKRFNFDKAGLYIIFFSLLVLWPFWRFLFGLIASGIYWAMRQAKLIKVVETQVVARKLEL